MIAMERGELVIIMENSGPYDSEDFYGRVGEYLFDDYGAAVCEIVGTSKRVLCKPENLVKVSAVPQMFEALQDLIEVAIMEDWQQATTGRQILLKNAQAAIDAAKGE